jgi:lycopene beta-cyclase
MHFRGWEIETPTPVFDPRMLTFLDFRVPQERALRFFYVLPFTERRAMVEYTLFSDQTLHREAYENALRSYLKETLGVETYGIVSTERGSVPITDQPLPRQRGRRILSIGAKAGRVKPSTGYAFVRVQKDSAGIVDSLLLYGHPFDVPEDPDLYDLLDAVMLQVMEQHGEHIQRAFTAMFQRNPVEHIFNFLDESATPWENLLLVSSLPPQLFIRSALSLLKVPPRALRGMMEG